MPNYFYDLPDDIQELIYLWVYSMIINEKPPDYSAFYERTKHIVVESDSDSDD